MRGERAISQRQASSETQHTGTLGMSGRTESKTNEPLDERIARKTAEAVSEVIREKQPPEGVSPALRRLEQRRPQWERETLLQVFLLGALANDRSAIEAATATDWTPPWDELVTLMQRALKGDNTGLDKFLANHFGIERSNGMKVIEAALERFRADAEFRTAHKSDPFAAQVARLMEAMRLRRERK